MCHRKKGDMATKIFFYVLIGATLFLACKETQGPEDKKPTPSPYAQTTIPWPSLANTPWPMHQHDPQGTGRSNLPGPSAGVIEWTFDLPIGYGMGMAMKNDSVLLLTRFGGSLYEVSLTGILMREIHAVYYARQAPTICSDGTIYLGLMTVLRNDTIRHSFTWAADIHSIQIGLDGAMYQLYLDNGKQTLEARYPNGTTKWKITDTRFQSYANSIVFSTDGTRLYVPGRKWNALLYAVDASNGSIVWEFGRTTQESPLSPMVDNAGRVYILGADGSYNDGKPSLFCISSDGSLVWSYAHGNEFDPGWGSPPTMDHNGNIYFALNALYSVTYEGALRWNADLPSPDMYIDKPLVCDKNNVIYAMLEAPNYRQYPRVMAYTSEGVKLWECEIPYNTWMGDISPVIAPGGRLIISGKNTQKYFCIR